MVLSAYLIGNMTAIIVKGSQTERFRDKMTDLIKYMNRNQLGKEIRSQIKDHLKLQYENSCAKHSMLEDIPIAIRSKVYKKTGTRFCAPRDRPVNLPRNIIILLLTGITDIVYGCGSKGATIQRMFRGVPKSACKIQYCCKLNS